MKRELIAKATLPSIPLGPEERMVATKKMMKIGMEENKITVISHFHLLIYLRISLPI